MSPKLPQSLETLALADPQLAAAVAERLASKPAALSPDLTSLLVAETLWALGVEISFGAAVAAGFCELIGDAPQAAVDVYRRSVRDAGGVGPSQGRVMAECLPAVLKHGDFEILAGYRSAWDVMARKGSYTLKEPLLALGRLFADGDIPAARVYLDLLRETFANELSYAECRYFSAALPKASLGFAAARRAWQLAALLRVIRADHRLAEPFLTGCGKGLALLSEKALDDFISGALTRCRRSLDLGRRHLALESRVGQESFEKLQVSVGLAQVQDRLQRYLRARTGLGLAIRPFSGLKAHPLRREAMVCSDGQAIYLPDEIDRFSNKQDNVQLYTLLVRLEASFHEFGTVDFDLQKALERCRPDGHARPAQDAESGERSAADEASVADESDLQRFLGIFPDKALAADLFTVFELGRIRKRFERHYPGLVRRFFPLLRRESAAQCRKGASGRFITGLLNRVALLAAEQTLPAAVLAPIPELFDLCSAVDAEISVDAPVESSAELTARFYETARRGIRENDGDRRLATPFGWRPWPNPVCGGGMPHERPAGQIRDALTAIGIKVYKSELRRRLAANAGALSLQDIRILSRLPDLEAARVQAVLDFAAGESLLNHTAAEDDAPAFRYPEWDVHLGDYLQQHVLLRERALPAGDGGFYAAVLNRRYGLVAETRRAFEHMRPAGLKRLRHWPDGDEFDYRQLIDRAVDRRIGKSATDRVFIKRLKARRDVAVLVLVDVSRSTASSVAGSDATVLTVEKEAVVLLCEALGILGDAFAVAGFSGSGRLGAEYFRVKGFGEPMSHDVAARIGALAPQRNTRMGAAVRHAGRELENVSARVRLLMILSDGFPNDADYKRRYAVADTRRALLELMSRGIRFHAVTVSLPADAKLDELYGKCRHHVISDVRELPGRLLRVYSALTRS